MMVTMYVVHCDQRPLQRCELDKYFSSVQVYQKLLFSYCVFVCGIVYCLFKLLFRVIWRSHKETPRKWLSPGVPVHRGNNHCTPLFTNLCLAVEHCWVFCIGSCEPVHEPTEPRNTFSQFVHSSFTFARTKTAED